MTSSLGSISDVQFEITKWGKFREMVLAVLKRELRVRSVGTIAGLGWVLALPLLQLAVFIFVFHRVLGVQTGEIPYPLVTLAGVLSWRQISSALGNGTDSLRNYSSLITKMKVDRVAFPTAAAITPLVELFVALPVLFLLVFYYGIMPKNGLFFLPVMMALTVLFTFGVGAGLSALNILFRDVRYLVNVLLPLLFLITPVAYTQENVPTAYRRFLLLNPAVPFVEGFRAACFGDIAAVLPHLVAAVFWTGLAVTVGLLLFSRLERLFGDLL